MNRTISLLLASGLTLLSSCNTQFNREWNEAGRRTQPVQSIEGRWEGTWESLGTGHSGRLRCVVGAATNSEGDHPFLYRATWTRLFSGSFASTHRVQAGGGALKFHGTHEMPAWAGGTYTYDGTVKNGRFAATYRCAKDHGTFVMARPAVLQ